MFDANSSTTPDIRHYLKSLWARRHSWKLSFQADLRAAGANTTLGNLWSVAKPLFQAGIYAFLYSCCGPDPDERSSFPC